MAKVASPDNEIYVFPLSFAQERLWFLSLLEPESAAYNVARAFRITGGLDVDCLRRVFEAMVGRHEALRTTISAVDRTPMQMVAQKGSVDVRLVDLSSLPKAEQDSETERVAGEEFRTPFRLAEGPLLRVTLLRLGDTEHVLFLTISHVVSDGWSMGIMVQEMTELYEAFSAGRESPLPELPVQYVDFAHWQREYLKGEVLEGQLKYWKRQLGGALPVLEMPADYARPPVQTYRGKRRHFTLGKQLTDDLNALSKREGVTLFMTLLAAFQALLYRHTGQEDVIVGSPIANRSRVEIEGIIGFFINTLALRADLSGEPTFRELVNRVKAAALGAYGHQDLPFEKLVEELQVPRSLNHSPVFQVMFILQNTPQQSLPFSSLKLSPMDIDGGTSKFDLTLELAERESGLAGWIEYSTDLFAEATIDRLVGHLRRLLEAVVADPEQRISELPMLTAEERHQLLVEWNDTRVEYAQDRLLHQVFEDQVEKTPERVALVFEEEQLTYGELNARVNQLAHFLRAHGVGPETLVGVAMERSLEMVIALYGIIKAGGAYVPIAPSFPEERIATLMEDSAVGMILTQAAVADTLPPTGARVVRLDADWDELLGGHSTQNPVSEVTLDNLAYAIYTSGSTGRPKGVMNTHRGILNRLLWMQDTYRLTESDRVLQKTPFNFDVSVWEFFWPLMFGARLVVAQPDAHRDSDYLVRTIISQQITIMHMVPSMLRVFLMAANVEACDSLRHLICSGETLSLGLQNRYFARLDARLHNLYGPTEAAVDVTFWECQRETNLATVPIGRPVANTQLYILDGHMQPVPIGVAGELYIGGVQVARGYLNRPELTAEVFIPDPFSQEPGARLYRTGDVARYLPDGNIDFLGRLDYQVKIRGNRVELGEIESVLNQHPAVCEAVVLAREDVPGDQRLVAYVTLDQSQANPAGALREFVRQKLPDFMVPSHFVVLDEFPRSAAQKIDRKSLPAPDRGQAEPKATCAPPGNALQRTIAGIWQEFLKIDRVDINDNFFELGGHSLLLVQVYYKLTDCIDAELTITDMFMYPTISALTAYLSQGLGEGKAAGQAGVERAQARRKAITRRRQTGQRVTQGGPQGGKPE